MTLDTKDDTAILDDVKAFADELPHFDAEEKAMLVITLRFILSTKNSQAASRRANWFRRWVQTRRAAMAAAASHKTPHGADNNTVVPFCRDHGM